MPKTNLPTYDALMNPLILALKALGGSSTIEELEVKVAEILGLSDEQLEVIHDPKKGGQSQFSYNLAWSRTYLKRFGVVENSSRGVWALTSKGNKIDRVDDKEVVRYLREQSRATPRATRKSAPATISEPVAAWRDDLLVALRKLEPAAFERLIQRILRESGFVQVEVTGRSGDRGIDGHGIMRLAGLLSFQVIFQAKKWRGSIGPSEIRDFRGAMVGRADKGLFITTGTFTKEATREATRDGAPAIDLVDGEQLIDKLKELSLGVQTQKVQIEQVSIEPAWFESL